FETLSLDLEILDHGNLLLIFSVKETTISNGVIMATEICSASAPPQSGSGRAVLRGGRNRGSLLRGSGFALLVWVWTKTKILKT
ncbi:MAG: hypothetical protein PHG32_08110, partial [Candidatus Cloacimonetes bacterium]|nr:hypothetical protein [Candidatus Cloacimonadota bacterium]